MTILEERLAHERKFSLHNVGAFIFMHGLSPVKVKLLPEEEVTPADENNFRSCDVNDLDLGRDGFYIRAGFNLVHLHAERLGEIYGEVIKGIGSPSPSVELFDIFGCGQYPQRVETSAITYTEEYQVPAQGVLAKLKKKETKLRQISVRNITHRTCTLGDLLTTTTTPNEPAYFIYMSIPTEVKDNVGRPGCEPELIVIASLREVQRMLETVWRNPQGYMNIVDVLFPPDLYPNIAKVTLRAVPHNSILFLEASQVKNYLKSYAGGTIFAHNSSNKRYTEHFVETAGCLVHV